MPNPPPATIRLAADSDWRQIAALLNQNGLPLDGLRKHLSTALVAEQGGVLVGSAALEVYGTAALLRSVAVDKSHKGHGLGYRLTTAALDMARTHSIQSVYLLTETAADYFPRFGFHVVARNEVPESVRQSVEFTSACPESAMVMRAAVEE